MFGKNRYMDWMCSYLVRCSLDFMYKIDKCLHFSFASLSPRVLNWETPSINSKIEKKNYKLENNENWCHISIHRINEYQL